MSFQGRPRGSFEIAFRYFRNFFKKKTKDCLLPCWKLLVGHRYVFFVLKTIKRHEVRRVCFSYVYKEKTPNQEQFETVKRKWNKRASIVAIWITQPFCTKHRTILLSSTRQVKRKNITRITYFQKWQIRKLSRGINQIEIISFLKSTIRTIWQFHI